MSYHWWADRGMFHVCGKNINFEFTGTGVLGLKLKCFVRLLDCLNSNHVNHITSINGSQNLSSVFGKINNFELTGIGSDVYLL